jgi:uncharacterized membrane protein YtjA (UPF0391 family)
MHLHPPFPQRATSEISAEYQRVATETQPWPESCESSSSTNQRNAMLHWTITFLILALVAGLLGFTGMAGASYQIAQVLFFVFLVMLVISFLKGGLKGSPR